MLRHMLAVAVLAALTSAAYTDTALRVTPPGDSTFRPLPQPGGPHRVGTTILSVVDSSRLPGDTSTYGQRRIMVQLWYPAARDKASILAPYVPDSRLIDAMATDNPDSLIVRRWSAVKTHSYLNAPIERGARRYPLLLFSHGLGTPRSNYTSLLEDLASYGYVIAAIDHPFGGMTIFPDGRIVAAEADTTLPPDVWAARTASAWAADVSFILTSLRRMGTGSDRSAAALVARSLDFDRVGMFGHSSGGVAAFEACRVDRRMKACVDLDGGPLGMLAETGLDRPVLLIGSHPVYSDADLKARGRTREFYEQAGRRFKADIDRTLGKRPETPAYVVKIDGTNHSSFSDYPFVYPHVIARFRGRIIDPTRGWTLTGEYLRAFFGCFLDQRPTPLLRGNAKKNPEAVVTVLTPAGEKACVQ